MAVFLVRHGESSGNRMAVFSGVSDHPLTEDGRRQAMTPRSSLAGRHFQQIFTSELSRTVDTAVLMLEANRCTWSSWVRDPRLNERNFGIYENRTRPQIIAESGDELCARIDRDISFPVEGGESIVALYERVTTYFDATIRAPGRRGDVLVVSHGNVTKCLIAHCLGWPLEIIPEIPMWNCLLTRVVV